MAQHIFSHRFLKFTYEFSSKLITFLDLNISLSENNSIETTIYRKPVSKHEFLHYSSNHPRHLLKSLPYSCGLRIIRSCSNYETKQSELNLLMEKFKVRNYPYELLESTLNKLHNIDRIELLRPKSKILLHHLSIHRPDILGHYDLIFNNIQLAESSSCANSNKHSIFIVFPFFNNIRGMGGIARKMFIQELTKCRSRALQKCICDLNIRISFSLSNSLSRFIQNLNKA